MKMGVALSKFSSSCFSLFLVIVAIFLCSTDFAKAQKADFAFADSILEYTLEYNVRIGCWLPDLSSCGGCFVLGGVCSPVPEGESAPKPPDQVSVWKGSGKEVDSPLFYEHIWDNGAVSFWRPVCADEYVALGDIAVHGVQSPSTEIFKCVKEELVDYPVASGDAELAVIPTNSSYVTFNIYPLLNYPFFFAHTPQTINALVSNSTAAGEKTELQRRMPRCIVDPEYKDCVHGSWSSCSGNCVCTSPWHGTLCDQATACALGTPGVTYSAYGAVSCYGGNNGYVTIAGSGGAAPYTYYLNSGTSPYGATFYNLYATTYNFFVIDSTGCQSGTGAIGIPGPSSSVGAGCSAGPTCYGQATGYISSSAWGGVGGYSYSYDGANYGQPQTVYNLGASGYTVWARDSNGCVGAGSCTVSSYGAIGVYGPSVSAPTCAGGTGAVTLSAYGGTGSFQFAFNGAGWTSNNYYSGLPPGTYGYYVQDTAGCPSGSIYQTVTIPNAPSAVGPGTPSVSGPTCAGGTGSITLTAYGGNGNYQYNWNGGGWTTNPSYGGLSPGVTYGYWVADTWGCPSGGYYTTVTIPAAPSAVGPGTPTVYGATCAGGTGSITLSAYGGNGHYQYNWNGGGWTTNPSYGSLTPGATYGYYVADTAGCPSGGYYTTITIPAAPSAVGVGAPTVYGATCAGGTGTVTLAGYGGNGQYQYNFNGGGWTTTSTYGNLIPGQTYGYYVADTAGCPSGGVYATVTIPAAPAAVGPGTPSISGATCAGGTGSATLTAYGGNGNYQFNFNGGGWTTTASYGSLTPGQTYGYYVADTVNCPVGGSYATLTIPAAPAAVGVGTPSPQPPRCNGEASGSVTLSGAGGNGQYQFNFNNLGWSATATYNNLVGGQTYSYYVRDTLGCGNAYGTVTIPDRAQITASCTPTSVTCNGDSTGSFTVSAGGGAGGYSYSIDNSAFSPTPTFGSLAAGDHSFWVKDQLGCSIQSSAHIDQPAAVGVGAPSPQAPTCYGAATGAVTLAGTGGNGNYVFNFDSKGYTATATYSGLSGGVTYGFYVMDSQNCGGVYGTVTIPSPTQIAATYIPSPVPCNGDSTGSFTVTNPTGGAGGYSYSINNVDYTSNPAFGSLAAGDHSFWVRDQAGCTIQSSAHIDQNTAVGFGTPVPQAPLCYGAASGSVTLSGTGGNGNYLFNFNNLGYSATAAYSGLSAGVTYDYYVEDSLGCGKVHSTVSIQDVTQITATYTTTSVACYGGSAGSFTITAQGGAGGYSYSIDNVNFLLSATFGSLPAGDHSFWVKDQNGCVIQSSAHIDQATKITATSSTSPAVCFNGATGSLTLTAQGGAGNYEYSIDGTNFQTSNIFEALTSQSYSYWVRDSSLCVVQAGSDFVDQNAAISASATASDNQICQGTPSGSITVSASGGTGPFKYSIDGTNFYDSPDFGSLAGGSYTFTVRDSHLCTATGSVSIGAPDSSITATASKVDLQCNGDGDTGSISITAQAGTSPYTYSIDGGATFVSQSTFTGLAPATYTVVVQDASLCSFTISSVEVSRPSAVGASVLVVPQQCVGTSTGSVTFTPSGGRGGYLLSLNGSAERSDTAFTSLAPATYSWSVKDTSGCVATGAVEVPAATPLVLDFSAQPACHEGSNGKITVSATGGAGGFSYSENDIDYLADPTFTGFATGNQMYYVKDSNGCKASSSAFVPELHAVLGNATVVQQKCDGTATGSVTLFAQGGIGANYQFSDDGVHFTTSNIFASLWPGDFSYTIEDSYGCQGSVSASVPPISAIEVVATQEPQTCVGTSTGSISLSAAGGSGGYQYSVDGVSYFTSGEFTDLSPANYVWHVKDSNGCQKNDAITVAAATPLTGTAQISHPLCNGDFGSFSVSGSGGVGGFSYSMDDETYSPSGNFTNLLAGTYTWWVKDANGCKYSESVTLVQNLKMNATVTVTPINCFGESTGIVLLAGLGGTRDYQFSFNGNAFSSSAEFSGIAAGTYPYSVTDSHQCTYSSFVTVKQANKITASAITHDLLCFVDTDSAILQITMAQGGFAPYTYSLDGTNFVNSSTFEGLNSGSYNWFVTDSVGCSISSSVPVVIGRPTVVGASVQVTNVTCKGDTTGSFVVTGSGGTGTYMFSRDSYAPAGNNVFANLGAGVYEWFISDSNNCTAQGAVTVYQPSVHVNGTYTSTPVTCSSAGTITLSGSEVAPPFLFSVDGSDFTSYTTFTGLATGDHTWSIQDTDGCIASGVAFVDTQSTVSASASKSNVLCNGGENGEITVYASGGSGGYSYSVNGSEFQGSPTFSNLRAGKYVWKARDSQGCVFVSSSTITQPPALTVNTVVTDNVCHGWTSGSIDARLGGGQPPYIFTMNNSNSTVATNLTAGAYNWNLTDANGCSISGYTVVGQPADLPPPQIISTSNVPTRGGIVTVIGHYFFPPLSIFIDGELATCQNTTNDDVGDDVLVCHVEAGTGSTHAVKVQSGRTECGITTETSWSYAQPMINNVSTITIHGGALTVQGDQFGTSEGLVSVYITNGSEEKAMCSGCTVAEPHVTLACTSCPAGLGVNNLMVSVDGLQSAPFEFKYLDVPASPTNISITPRPRSFAVTWQGDETATSYYAEAITTDDDSNFSANVTGKIAAGGNSRQFEVTGLQPSTTYDVRIRESNIAGDGNFSSYVQVTTKPAVPNQPTPPVVSIVNATCINISWRTPYSGGTEITKYNLQIQASGQTIILEITAPITSVDYTVSPNGHYTIAVQATNGVGAGDFSEPVSFVMPDSCGNGVCDTYLGETCGSCYQDCSLCQMAPPTFESLHAFANSSNTIVAVWTTYANALSGTFYILQMSTSADADFSVVYTGTDTRFVVHDLSIATNYYFRLAAAYTSITGPFSAVSQTTTSGMPNAPELTLAQHTRDYLVVSWAAPVDGGCALSQYRLQFSNSSDSWQSKDVVVGSPLRMRYSGLQANTAYSFRAESFNLIGNSPMSAIASFTTDAAKCGDFVCDKEVGENCSNCFVDCGACSYPACGGTPECNGQGSCMNGVCNCNQGWSGPECSDNGNVPIVIVSGKDNSTTVSITPQLPPEQESTNKVAFNVSLTRIQEVDMAGNVFEYYDLFNLSADTNATEEKTTYSVVLPNSAILEIDIYSFANATTYQFAGKNISIPDNSMKYSIRVSNWAFSNVRNNLQIFMLTTGSGTSGDNGEDLCTVTETGKDGSDNLQWFTLNVGGVTLYTQFVEDAVIDDRYGKVKFAVSQNNTDLVYLTIPSFWEYAVVDPVYSLLFDPKSSSNAADICRSKASKNVNTTVVASTIGGVAGAAVAVMSGVLLRREYQRRQMRHHVLKRRSASNRFADLQLIDEPPVQVDGESAQSPLF